MTYSIYVQVASYILYNNNYLKDISYFFTATEINIV